MSMPVGPGWYDDPDDPKAERWWDGGTWSPNRRRKEVAPPTSTFVAPPSQSYPTQAYEPLTVQPYPSAESYPAYTHEASNVGSFMPTDPPPPVVAHAIGSSFGVDEVIAGLFALCGLGLVASAFTAWGRVSDADSGLSLSLEYPGIGDPSAKGRSSDVAVDFSDVIQHNVNNPGWIALVLGVLLVAVSAGHYLAWNRRVLDIVAAASSAVVLIVCISHVSDLRGAFGDPPVFPGIEFAPGLGLIATMALSVLAAVAGVAGFAHELRRT